MEDSRLFLFQRRIKIDPSSIFSSLKRSGDSVGWTEQDPEPEVHVVTACRLLPISDSRRNTIIMITTNILSLTRAV